METLIELAFEAMAIIIKQLKALGVSDKDIATRSAEFIIQVDQATAKDRAGDLDAMKGPTY